MQAWKTVGMVLVLLFVIVGIDKAGLVSKSLTGDTVSEDIVWEDYIELSKKARLERPCVEERRICSDKTVYECQNNTYKKVEDCDAYCNKGKCVECLDWVMNGSFSIIKGHLNQCRGDDLYTCEDGRWKKLIQCPKGCMNRPYLRLQDGVAWADRKTDSGGLLLAGHCFCDYRDPDLCIDGVSYKCLGWEIDSHYYTRMGKEACENRLIWFYETEKSTESVPSEPS